jgi:hypothetical protein
MQKGAHRIDCALPHRATGDAQSSGERLCSR